MNTLAKLVLITAGLLLSTTSVAQSEAQSADDELKIAALEALMTAPPDRALPLVNKVLDGNHSDDVKERALFILSQIDAPEAQSTLLRFARDESGDLQAEAIRMIGISGNQESLTNLTEIYQAANRDTRDAILEAYLIAGDKRAVYEIAVNADNEEDFEEAVEILGAMGARDELRELRSRAGMSGSLVNAYAMSGDIETLRELAVDGSNVALQAQAIEAMGIVGGDDVDATLVEIYRNADSDEIREAALEGLLISGHDAGLLELYRSSEDPAEKRELLEYLVMMGSDDVWTIIDSALAGDQ